MTIYRLQAVFLDSPPTTETKHLIIYNEVDNQAAVRAAWRWVRNRQRNLPEVFGDLAGLKVHYYEIETPHQNGYIGTRGTFDFYEWKCDWGIPQPEFQ